MEPIPRCIETQETTTGWKFDLYDNGLVTVFTGPNKLDTFRLPPRCKDLTSFQSLWWSVTYPMYKYRV